MNLQTLKERRAAIVKQMRQLNDLAEREERDLSSDEQSSFGELKGKLAALEKQIERSEIVAEAERTMSTPEQRRGNDGNFEELAQSFQVTRAIAHAISPGEVDAGRELEISQELSRRAGRRPEGIFMPHQVFMERRDVLTSGTGASLYPEVHRGDLFIDRLRASLKTQTLGATVLNGLVGEQDIPRLTGSATAYWVAEHSDVTESDHTFDTVGMAPKTVGAEVEYSRRMMINAVPSVETLVRGDLANVLATAIDDKAINGDATSNTPRGVLNTSGIGSVSFAGAPTWAGILDHIAEVSVDNALDGSLGWLTNPYAVKTMRSTVKVASTDSEFIQSDPGMLAGYQLQQSTLLPGDPGSSPVVNGTLVFGNWADLMIGYWSAVDILVNPYHSDVYSKGGVKINALQDCDIAVRHPESFCASQDMVL